MKVGLISGHGAGDCGACGYGYEEANETIRIVKALDAKLEACGIDTVVYPYERNAFKDCNRGLGLQVDFSGCDYVVEVHLNSGRGDETGDDSVGGTEIYVTPREATTGTENLILEYMEELGYRNRGVKAENFLVINKVKNLGVSSALLETCFVDDVDDMELYENTFDETISAIARGICVGFGVGYTEDTDDSTDEQEESTSCMSREEKEYYVNCTYLELLGRLADSDGLENYVNAIPDDTTWDSNLYEYVDANIKQSEEYVRHQRDEYIRKVYLA